MKIFIDTSAIIALYSLHDQSHKEAEAVVKNLAMPNVEIFTTDYVIDEVYTGLISNPKAGYRAVLRFDKRVEEEIWTVIYVDKRVFQQARKVFKQYNQDKTWSFTDCTSYVVMKDYGIRRIFTFDEDFAQMGFWVLRG